jgi:hypothetical protein
MNSLKAYCKRMHGFSANLGRRLSNTLPSALLLAAALLLLSPWAVAAPAFQSQSTATSASDVQTLTIATPAGALSGDLLLATIATDGSEVFNTPVGWTEIDQGDSGGSVSVVAFYRIATATEPTSHTFTWGSNEEAAGAILRYSGVSSSNPIDAFVVATGPGDNPTAPTVTTLSADTRVVRIYGADDDDLAANPFPPGTTGRLNIESGAGGGTSSLGVADSAQTAIGATGSAAFSTSASEQWRALTVVLAPPGVNVLPPNDQNNAPAICSASAADGSGTGGGGGGGISGVVNRYYPGTTSVSAGATSIALGASIGAGSTINPGDTLLVIQMQDALITTSNNANYGDGTGLGTADGSGSSDVRQTGLYEFAVATNTVGASGGTVTLSAGLTHAYNRGTNRRFQVIRVPRYSSVSLSGTVTAAAWNGLAGGVVVMSVQGALTFGSNGIDVNGQGFRGGNYTGTDATGSGDSSTDYVVAAGTRWGAKGEGIAGGPNVGPTPMANTDGYPGGSLARGAPGNAGGGGNDHNAGGGGGSNIGPGGRGGFPWPDGTVGGKGGAAFAGHSGRLLAGGGGGAGHKNNAGGTGVGGNGGGIVFINATTINAGSGFVRANGTDGDFSVQDGAGGGGGGGTILVRTDSSSVAGLTLSASGGNGGESYFGSNHGPGGGGGGGAVYIGATGGNTNISGGAPGVRRNSGPTDPAESTHGALGGQRGQVAPTNVPTAVPLPVACDFGDAPAAYFTASTLHSVGGAGGGSPNLRLGGLIDFEWQGDASSNALADDARDTSGTGAGSDEDGVVFTAPAGGGDNIIATVSVSNTTGSAATLCGWMDVNVNNVFDASERRCSSVPSGGTTNIPYEWLVSTAVTQSYLSRFRVCSVATQCDVPTGQALNGEMEDYSVSYSPTQVTIGTVELAAAPLSVLLTELLQQGGQDDASSALALLSFYDAPLAESLQGGSAAEVSQALTDYMDSDGDGQVVTLRWDTLEERGTIGFYVERRALGEEQWVRVNGDLLPGLITAPMGGEYWLADPGAQPGQTYEYQLIELEARGQLRAYGPWSLSLNKPEAETETGTGDTNTTAPPGC